VTDDRQTDRATEKCVGIGGIACAARAIPPKNDTIHNQFAKSAQAPKVSNAL